MENINKEEIRKIQAILTKISMGKKVFFNVFKYENTLGLVKSIKIYGTSSTGNKEVLSHKYQLKNKGKMLMDIAL